MREVRKAGSMLVGAAALFYIWSLMAAPAQGAPEQRFSENYLLPAQSPGHGRDVPGLAVDPSDPDHIVEAEIDPVNFQCDYNVSFDGGRTWSGGHLTNRNAGEFPPFPTPACSQNFDAGGYAHFNTGIVFGSGQNVYITFSAHRGDPNRLDTSPPLEGGAGDDSMVARSTDGGRTFAPAVRAIAGAPMGQPVTTRPQIAVQRGAGTGGLDRLYVNAWLLHVTAAGGPRQMVVARSDDAGATWTPAVVASARTVRNATDAATVGTADEIVRELSQPVVGPDGAVYAAYRSVDRLAGVTCPPNPVIPTNCIVIAKSADLGQTWTQRAVSAPLSGSTGQPRLAIDPSTPAGVGTLYVAFYRSVGADPDDVQLQRSIDGGLTWTPAVRVNDDPPGRIQSFPQVSVGPAGRVNVTWFDRRHEYPGPGGTRIGDIYYAHSTNGGASFGANRRVTDRSINRDVGIDAQLGSYSFYGPVTQSLGNGSLLTAFMDSRLGDPDNGIQDVFLSRSEPAAEMASSAIATATAPGLSVRLSRLAYPGGGEASGGDPVTRVVVVNESDPAAALAGAVLARASYGPVLLSPDGRLPAIVEAESARLEPVGAYVIGDSSSLSTAVSGALRDTTRKGENVTRIAPASNITLANRPAEIARQVAELLRPLPGATPEAVIVNPGTSEAVSAAALAAALRLPILFAGTAIPAPTTAAINSLGIKKVLIVGNSLSVGPAVENSLNTSLGAANVRRVGGADQYATSEMLLTEAMSRGLPANVVYVADGARAIDATVLGAAVGRLTGLMLLAPAASAATAQSRLLALGLDAPVDRVVSAIGTGGTDPTLPLQPPAQPPAGQPPTPPAPPPPPQPPARPAPPPLAVVSGLRLSPSSFRAARSGASVRSVVVRGRTRVSYRLNVPASVRFAIERQRPGRRVGGRCVQSSASNRGRPSCRRYVRVPGSFTRTRRSAGADRFTFTGRISGRSLSPSRYRLLATPRANARTGATKRASFRIVRR